MAKKIREIDQEAEMIMKESMKYIKPKDSPINYEESFDDVKALDDAFTNSQLDLKKQKSERK